MATDWRRSLEGLRDSLLTVREDDHVEDFHHALVFVPGDLPSMGSVNPCLYASAGDVLDRVVVPLPSGGFHLHFVLDEFGNQKDHRGLEALRRRLRDVSKLLARIPAKVLPQIQVPPRDNGTEENLLRWMYLLHWLGGTSNQVFHSEIEFLQSKKEFEANKEFEKWSNCSTIPDFEPLPLLTLTSSPDHGFEYWKEQHEKAGRRFPEVIASSLTKTVLYASANAPDMILVRDLAVPPAKYVLRGLSKAFDLGPRALELLSLLMHHHKCEMDDGPCFEPMQQEDIERLLKCSQSTVSRAVGDLFKDIRPHSSQRPMDKYRRLCEDHIIDRVLVRLSNPRPRQELDGLDMDDLEG